MSLFPGRPEFLFILGDPQSLDDFLAGVLRQNDLVDHLSGPGTGGSKSVHFFPGPFPIAFIGVFLDVVPHNPAIIQVGRFDRESGDVILGTSFSFPVAPIIFVSTLNQSKENPLRTRACPLDANFLVS